MSQIAKIKFSFSRNFTLAPNELLYDKNISLKAKGLFVFLCSLRDEWQLSIKWLQCHLKEGRDQIYNLLNELIKAGYIYREKVTDENNRLTGKIIYHFFENIKDNPYHNKTAEKNPEKNIVLSSKPRNTGNQEIGKQKKVISRNPEIPEIGTLNNINKSNDINKINKTHTVWKPKKDVLEGSANASAIAPCIAFLEWFLSLTDTDQIDVIKKDKDALYSLSLIHAYRQKRITKLIKTPESYARTVRRDMPGDRANIADFLVELHRERAFYIKIWEEKQTIDDFNSKFKAENGEVVD